MGWGCHTYSFTISLSRAHHLESITFRCLWLQFEWSMWRSHTVILLPPPPTPPSLSLHSSKQGQLRTELAPCLHLKPPPITALWHPHQHKHVVSPSPFPSLFLGYPLEREGGVFWSYFVWRDVRMEVLMEEKYLGHRWIRCWIRTSGIGSKFLSCIYRKRKQLNALWQHFRVLWALQISASFKPKIFWASVYFKHYDSEILATVTNIV